MELEWQKSKLQMAIVLTNKIEWERGERENRAKKNVYIFLHTLYKQTAAAQNTDEPIETKTRRYMK